MGFGTNRELSEYKTMDSTFDTGSKVSRRTMLKGVGAGVGSAALLGAAAATAGMTEPAPGGPAQFLNKGTRLTISMWDYSWLMDAGPGGAYADLERCVAGAAERGYNTLRVDVFVSEQFKDESRFEKNWDGGIPRWGMTRGTFTCNVRRRVEELARLCGKHGLWLGLDSWKTAPAAAEATDAQCERVFTQFGQLWAKALPILRDGGVLERAAWLSPLNEVPWHGAHAPVVQKLSREPVHAGLTNLEKTRGLDALYRRITDYMAVPIRAALGSDAVPLCYSSVAAEAYADRLSDQYDVVDVHFMPSVLVDDDDKAALERAGKGLSTFARFSAFAGADLKQFSSAWDAACRKHYGAMLQRAYDYHETACNHLVLPSGKRLQAVVTESFGPCYWPVHPDVNQAWYKDYNADAMRTVARLPLAGSSLSNYAEPLFAELWGDADWHWRSNAYFLAQRPVASG